MPVTRQWLPVEDAYEKQLVERLVSDGRSFVKGLRYNLSSNYRIASASLTDCEGGAITLLVQKGDPEVGGLGLNLDSSSARAWVWCSSTEPMPQLPMSASLGAAARRTPSATTNV